MGPLFSSQLQGLYRDMLNVYRLYSSVISDFLAQVGPHATGYTQVRASRSVKRAVLNLIRTYVEVSQEAQHVPPLLEAVLVDYPQSVPQARDAEVLHLIATVCARCGPQITPAVPKMFQAVFECTLQMLVNNFTDFPDHRHRFYSMLEAIVSQQFAAVLVIARQSGKPFQADYR